MINMKHRDYYMGWMKRFLTWDKLLFLILALIAVIVLEVTDIGCPILYLTGISCPGCGLTRAYFSLLRGDISGAFAYHPLWWGIPVGVLLLAVTEYSEKFRKLAGSGLVVLLLLWIIVYLERLFDMGDSVVFFAPERGAVARLFGMLIH